MALREGERRGGSPCPWSIPWDGAPAHGHHGRIRAACGSVSVGLLTDGI